MSMSFCQVLQPLEKQSKGEAPGKMTAQRVELSQKGGFVHVLSVIFI